jgi:hypothetical protein
VEIAKIISIKIPQWEKELLRSEAILTSASIDEALRRSLACLGKSFRTSNGRAGWYHYLDDANPGITASAVGLYCFHLAGSHFERTEEVLRYLLAEQVKTTEGRGGWSVRTTSGVPVVEATAWVLRALSTPSASRVACWQAIEAGAEWLAANQNTDFGWGSYKGQPSRVFTTALAMLALQECGAQSEAVTNAQKWLNEAQSPGQPAWGLLPGSEPTMLHTSMSLMALHSLHGALTPNAEKQTCDWLLSRLVPAEHTEKATIVEEYDVPYLHGTVTDVFQNSLPHFACPVTLTALMNCGADPLSTKIFATAESILNAQETEDPQRMGTWELPRSPLRPSIWAIWPFVAALSSVRAKIFPPTESRVTLLFPGCAIIQTTASPQQLTRRLLIRNAFLDWMRNRRLALALWAVAAIAVAIPLALLVNKSLNFAEFLVTLVIPVLLLTFQIILERSRNKDQ